MFFPHRVMWKDVVTSYVLRGNFLSELRDDPQKRFFYDLDTCDAQSLQAIEANYKFLLNVCATLAAESCVSAHGVWKAGCYLFAHQLMQV